MRFELCTDVELVNYRTPAFYTPAATKAAVRWGIAVLSTVCLVVYSIELAIDFKGNSSLHSFFYSSTSFSARHWKHLPYSSFNMHRVISRWSTAAGRCFVDFTCYNISRSLFSSTAVTFVILRLVTRPHSSPWEKKRDESESVLFWHWQWQSVTKSFSRGKFRLQLLQSPPPFHVQVVLTSVCIK